ncbi:alpha/beta-hydrolase [Byssothecium circinans]|uniref:Alpha/beta-hydrolase n=1 Tax=Byssothecium circinans TaxID=147558 RepID=A0A6A5THY4_9PLEO|nr:alpha/beta-hydrolase [Byssothecium circinans]
MQTFLSTAFATSLLFLSNRTSAESSTHTATIDSGAIIGTATSFPSAATAVNQFLGAPFVGPPKRFSLPQKSEPWIEPLKNKEKSPTCIQQYNYPDPGRNWTIQFFNNPEDPPKEIMVWIYGGGLYMSFASHPYYDGSRFAAYEDIIVVAVNYRTNDWVQRNIHTFGGDPSKVTLFGEISPRNSTPPFRAAVLQSGQLSYRGFPTIGLGYPNSTESWEALVKGLNCTGDALACVQKAPATTIKHIIKHQANNFWPVYNNKSLGRVLEFGVNSMTFYLERFLGRDADPRLVSAIREAYPCDDALSAIEMYVSYQCAAALVANDTAVAFNATFPNSQHFNGAIGGAYHASEISIVFSTNPIPNTMVREYFTSNFMHSTWARFAKDPVAGLGWNKVGSGGEYLDGAVDLDVGVIGEDGLRVVRQSDVDGRCGIWAGLLKRGL